MLSYGLVSQPCINEMAERIELVFLFDNSGIFRNKGAGILHLELCLRLRELRRFFCFFRPRVRRPSQVLSTSLAVMAMTQRVVRLVCRG